MVQILFMENLVLINEDLIKENNRLKRKIKILEETVNQSALVRANYNALIKKLEDRDNRLEEMNSKLEILVKQRTKELEEINQQLKALSITDALTGLRNRRDFDKTFESEFSRAKRQNYSFNILLIDIDNFKSYNDTYGHIQGDNALASVSEILLRYAKRANDFVFRYGGEEFVYISSFNNEKELLNLAENIRKAVLNKRILHVKNEDYTYLTISVGAVLSKNIQISKDEMFLKTDKNLYKAKSEGKNRVVITTL